MALGLVLGCVEAGLLYCIPRFSGLTKPDTRGAIWCIAPLADAPLFALAGLCLGSIAILPRRRRPRWQGTWAGAGVGLGAAYLGWLLLWFRVGRGILVPNPSPSLSPALYIAVTLPVYFGFGFLVSVLVRRLPFARFRWFASGAHGQIGRSLWFVNLAIAAALFSALVVIYLHPSQRLSSSAVTASTATPRNNIVLLVMDTVRADHLSCYGYPRPTTPNLSRLAAEGVLFEQAIAPTSWTLPSLASIYTGLLPHQHGATWQHAMALEPMTLAEILRGRGYETAAFNANASFGLAGWGLDQGFGVYADAHTWLRHNLAATFAGQSIYQALVREFVSFNEFDTLNAAEVNQQVFAWLQHCSVHPYFLFINYMDAHSPYLPPAPYDHRFGKVPKSVLRRLTYRMKDGRLSRPFSIRERQDVIDGYDNSLYFLDEQIARLLGVLRAMPGAGRTFVLVAGDHGEGFGEHGTYDHGWNLNREVLHVPLLINGPGVPGGRRVTGAVPLQELFPTVLRLAVGNIGDPVDRASLSRFWLPAGRPAADATPVLSELAYQKRDRSRVTTLSLCDGRWHYLLDSAGRAELFDWRTDAGETRNLADEAEFDAWRERLHSATESILARSLFPWRSVEYLQPLDHPGRPFFRRAAANPDAFQPIGWPVGSSQAFFAQPLPSRVARPTPSEEDLLRSLPYH
jgi:arylsulfatase A-like enzyme